MLEFDKNRQYYQKLLGQPVWRSARGMTKEHFDEYMDEKCDRWFMYPFLVIADIFLTLVSSNIFAQIISWPFAAVYFSLVGIFICAPIYVCLFVKLALMVHRDRKKALMMILTLE